MYWIVIILWTIQCSMSVKTTTNDSVTSSSTNIVNHLTELLKSGVNQSRITRPKQKIHYSYNYSKQMNVDSRRRDKPPALLQCTDCELTITGLDESRITKQEGIIHYSYKEGESIDLRCGRSDKQDAVLEYRYCNSTTALSDKQNTKDLLYKTTFFSENNNTCITCNQWTEWEDVELNSINIVFHLTQDGVFINGLPENNIREINKTHDEYTFNDKEKRTVSCTRKLKSNAIPYDLSLKLLDANDNDIFSYDNGKDESNKQTTITFYDYLDKHKLRCTAIEPKSSQTHEKIVILHRKEIGTEETETNDTIISKETIGACVVAIVVVILFIIGSVYFIRSRYRKPLNRLSVNELDYENLRGRPKLFTTSHCNRNPRTHAEAINKEPFYDTITTAAADSSNLTEQQIDDKTELYEYVTPIPKSDRRS